MKIYLDLLPKQKKEEIKRKKLFRKILGEEALFLLPVVVFIFILLNIYYVLTVERDTNMAVRSTQQSQGKYQQLSTYEARFKEVNAVDKALGQIQSGHLRWSDFFQQLSGITPDNVYITNLSTRDYAVFIAGKAKTRDDLLNFKSQLEAASCFQNVDVPLSNLVVKNDVDFQIDLVVTKDCLNKKQ
jgi:Tfp pilus assembly protein PilN